MKKLFFTILVVVFYGFCAVNAIGQNKKGEQSAEQKMEQLQKILERAAQSRVTPLPPTEADQDIMPTEMANQTSVAGESDNQDKAASSEPATSVAPTPKPNLYRRAFSNVINQMLPMSSDQVAKLREIYTESQLAAATPPGVPPKPTSTSLMVDLSPTATPPVIRLGAGYITSLVFMDATGQPWPIQAYSIGDPSAFNIQWNMKGNTLLVQSATFYKRSNMAVILQGLNTPVMIDLISGQKAVDYRVDLRVPGLGPNAVFAYSGIPESTNPVLLNVLNGVPPKGSKELKVSGGDCQAWLLDKQLYLRTNLTVISPGWKSIMSSIDGTRAYQLQPAPIVLALQNGRDKVLTLMLEGLE